MTDDPRPDVSETYFKQPKQHAPPPESPNGGGGGWPESAAETPVTLRVVTLDEFVGVDEPGADPVVGTTGSVVIGEGGDVMFYGDGGVGKTTLSIDLAFHLAAGDDWLGITVARPVRVLIVENEGPRPLFRQKLKRKRDAWSGSQLGDRLRVFEQPWGEFSFAESTWRERVAVAIRDQQIDVLIVGPVTSSGMNAAGTLQEVREFAALVARVRKLSGRNVAIILIHHENRAGQVSGAWEPQTDTLFHVQQLARGRLRLYIQKARWSSEHHAVSLQLAWAEGDGFTVEEKPELDDETLADRIIAAIAADPGTGWTRVEEKTPGVARDRRRNVRDVLLKEGVIVNVAKDGDATEVALDHCPERRSARLYLGDDPTIQHLRREPGADAAQIAPPGGEGPSEHLRRAPRPIRGAGVAAQMDAPLPDLNDDADREGHA
jgi:hypothetical protein